MVYSCFLRRSRLGLDRDGSCVYECKCRSTVQVDGSKSSHHHHELSTQRRFLPKGGVGVLANTALRLSAPHTRKSADFLCAHSRSSDDLKKDLTNVRRCHQLSAVAATAAPTVFVRISGCGDASDARQHAPVGAVAVAAPLHPGPVNLLPSPSRTMTSSSNCSATSRPPIRPRTFRRSAPR